MTLTRKSLLDDFKNRNLVKGPLKPRENPGVSKQLIHWLETQEFPREPFLANDPLISQKLLIREGIEMVLRRLKQEYDLCEKSIAESHAESNTLSPR